MQYRVDNFKVPGDDGYAYDDYGERKVLDQPYLSEATSALNLALFFPAQASEQETGAKRGCVVLSGNPDLAKQLNEVKTLTRK